MKKLFENYWSLLGLIAAICSVIAMYIFRDTFFAGRFWMLWMFIPILMLHNFEESFFPGNFLPWFNKTCFKSKEKYFPSGKFASAIFAIINCWILTLIAALIADIFILLSVIMFMLFIQNSWMHVSYTLSSNKYSPGAITSFFLVIPFTFYTLFKLIINGEINILELSIGYIIGTLLHYNMFFMIRTRYKKVS